MGDPFKVNSKFPLPKAGELSDLIQSEQEEKKKERKNNCISRNCHLRPAFLEPHSLVPSPGTESGNVRSKTEL